MNKTTSVFLIAITSALASSLATYYTMHRSAWNVDSRWESSADMTRVSEDIVITNRVRKEAGIKEIALYSSSPSRPTNEEKWCFQDSGDYVFGYNNETVMHTQKDKEGRKFFDVETSPKVEAGYYFILRKSDGSGSIFLSKSSFLAALKFSYAGEAILLDMRPKERCDIKQLRDEFTTRTQTGGILLPHVRFFDEAIIERYVVQ